jgi:hypothetical protein
MDLIREKGKKKVPNSTNKNQPLKVGFPSCCVLYTLSIIQLTIVRSKGLNFLSLSLSLPPPLSPSPSLSLHINERHSHVRKIRYKQLWKVGSPGPSKGKSHFGNFASEDLSVGRGRGLGLRGLTVGDSLGGRYWTLMEREMLPEKRGLRGLIEGL